MPKLHLKRVIHQSAPEKGGYFYCTIHGDEVALFEKGKHQRLLVSLNDKIEVSCELNLSERGAYFVILAGEQLKKLKKQRGNEILLVVTPHPNPLGVEMPTVLQTLLDEDEWAQTQFKLLSDNKKRRLICRLTKIQDMDRQIEKIQFFLDTEERKRIQKHRKAAKL